MEVYFDVARCSRPLTSRNQKSVLICDSISGIDFGLPGSLAMSKELVRVKINRKKLWIFSGLV